MTVHLVAACLALSTAFVSGTLTKENRTGLGGPFGAASTLWFIAAAVLEIAAVR